MAPTTPADIESEDSVFRHLFSNEVQPRKITKAERMARIFENAAPQVEPIDIGDFLPRY